MDLLDQEITDYLLNKKFKKNRGRKIPNALLNKNIELITSLEGGILNSLREEFVENCELANKPIETAEEKILKLANVIKKDLGEEPFEVVKEAKSLKEHKIIIEAGKFTEEFFRNAEIEAKKIIGEETFEALTEASKALGEEADIFEVATEARKTLGEKADLFGYLRHDSLGYEKAKAVIKAVGEEPVVEEIKEILKDITEDKQDEYVLKAIETISLLIENTQAMQVLVKKGFALQATMMARNSVEILLRIIVQVDHYKSANYDPTKIDELKIENTLALITYLQKKAKKNKVKFKGLANESFEIVTKMFPDKEHPFYDFAKGLKDWYGELCGFTHPEVQLKERHSRVFGSSIYSGPLRPASSYPANTGLMINIFLCNALAVRLIIGLLKNRMKDENYDKNIINVDKAYNDFYSFYDELRKKNPKEISAELIQRSIKSIIEQELKE